MDSNKIEAGSLESLKAGIVWREKLDYGKTITTILSLWIAAQFVLQMFFHPGFILAFGCIYALIIGMKAGGNEVSDGAEEFSFSLSSPRSIRYKCKYIYGLKPLLLILVLGLLTIYFNLSQLIWSLFVDSDLNNPYAIKKAELFWYILSFLLPVCLYTTIFSATICTYGRSNLIKAVLAGLFISGLAVIIIVILYYKTEPLVVNILSILILGLVISISCWLSYKTYCFKEGVSVSRPSVASSTRSGIIIIIAILLIIIFLGFFVMIPVQKNNSTNQPTKVKIQ